MSLLLQPARAGIWRDWVPTVQQNNLAFGSGSIPLTVAWARTARVGGIVIASCRVTITGAGGTAGLNIKLALPEPAAKRDTFQLDRLGWGYVYRSVPAAKYEFFATADGPGAINPPAVTLARPTDAAGMSSLGSTGIVGALVADDFILCNFEYEAAS